MGLVEIHMLTLKGHGVRWYEIHGDTYKPLTSIEVTFYLVCGIDFVFRIKLCNH